MTIREAFETARSAKEAFERNTEADTSTKRVIGALYRTVEAMVEAQDKSESAKPVRVPQRQRETATV